MTTLPTVSESTIRQWYDTYVHAHRRQRTFASSESQRRHLMRSMRAMSWEWFEAHFTLPPTDSRLRIRLAAFHHLAVVSGLRPQLIG